MTPHWDEPDLDAQDPGAQDLLAAQPAMTMIEVKGPAFLLLRQGPLAIEALRNPARGIAPWTSPLIHPLLLKLILTFLFLQLSMGEPFYYLQVIGSGHHPTSEGQTLLRR